ncbi:MAG TPA: DUF2254 family protein [Terriglobales bacterium]
MLSVSAFNLYIRKGVRMEPLIHGAGHESGRYAGTESVLLDVGLRAACELARSWLSRKWIREPRDLFWELLTSVVRAPLSYAVTAVAAGLVFPRLEIQITRGLTLPGVVFSLAFVMIQFSATAYSPRLVLWISREPFIWHTVGVFTATFLYAIAALAWVDRSGSTRVRSNR